MSELPGVRGRVVVVTGAAHGIGAATVRVFAEAGARVAALDRDESVVGQVAALERQGAEVVAAIADVADPASVDAALRDVREQWGRIDVLINNAGILRDAMLSDVTDDDWRAVLDVNLDGVRHCTQAAVPAMLEQGFGRVLSATSIIARYGNPGQTTYAASKGGVIAMTRSWARELGPKGVTANAVAPGFIETRMTLSVPPRHLEAMTRRIPLGRKGQPREVANVYLFLASDWARHINGAVVGVDGGLRL